MISRNVSFSYPGAQSGAALSDISLNIEAGSLVVLVGANGSGKSTLVRLLSRLYKPSSGGGGFLIDGLPAEDYRMVDLYRAIALLSQENRVYPLSLGENISLGSTHGAYEEEVAEAARLGGATEFISRFEKGMNTELKVFDESMAHNLHGKPDHPLVQEMKRLPNDIDISGGEKQRLIA
jgi:ABC-type bacteriocin/lantibiotic exporter with double-glycine peptidase domain